MVDENPYQPPNLTVDEYPQRPLSLSVDPQLPKKRSRFPWIFVGLQLGIIAMVLILPACSDSRGIIQTNVILGCLIGGPILGAIVDFAMR